MDLKEAIEFTREVLERAGPNDATNWEKSRRVLLNAAEAWVELYNIANQATENGEWPYLIATMDEILPPAPKTDIQRVREWVSINKNNIDNGMWGSLFVNGLIDFLDQLEAEKK